MLNRTLWLTKVDIIVNMGFFIRNLNHNMDQLYNEHFGSRYSGKSFRDYCDQDISKLDFHQMMKTKGGLIYFNNFLSTSKDRNVGLFFAESNVSSPNLISILFVMAINPSKSTTTFEMQQMKLSSQYIRFFVLIVLHQWVKILVSSEWN
jgi:hypothetical protein